MGRKKVDSETHDLGFWDRYFRHLRKDEIGDKDHRTDQQHGKTGVNVRGQESNLP